MHKELILGIGNTIRGDDALGIYIAEELKTRADRDRFDILSTQEAGLAWLDIITGYKRAIIIDSIKTKNGRPGQLYRITANNLGAGSNPVSFHQLSLAGILGLGRKLKLPLPDEVIIYAIEAGSNQGYSQRLSRGLKRVSRRAAVLINAEIERKRRV